MNVCRFEWRSTARLLASSSLFGGIRVFLYPPRVTVIIIAIAQYEVNERVCGDTDVLGG